MFLRHLFICGLILLLVPQTIAAKDKQFRVCGWASVDQTALDEKVAFLFGGHERAPAAVQLTRLGSDGETLPDAMGHCGGVLVAPDWVLTARHCVDGKTWSRLEVHFGAADLSDPDFGATRVGILAICPSEHPVDSIASDVALLRLNSPVDDGQPTAALSDPGGIERVDTAVLASWSAEMEGQETNPLRLTPVTLGEKMPSGHLIGRRILSHEPPPCGGESGSPLFVETKAGVEVIGILSAVQGRQAAKAAGEDPCLSEKVSPVFTSLAEWTDWIEHTIDVCTREPMACKRDD